MSNAGLIAVEINGPAPEATCSRYKYAVLWPRGALDIDARMICRAISGAAWKPLEPSISYLLPAGFRHLSSLLSPSTI